MSLPHALDRAPSLIALRRAAGRMLVALDFDGTLSPIVERPEDAALHGEVGDPLRRLADRPDTVVAIVSGRGLSDVRERVGLEALYYAGNHGFEIEGPGVDRVHPEAEPARPELEACIAGLEEALADEPGTEVEDKRWTLSIHYRRAEREGAEARVRAAVETHCRRPGLRVTEGKKLFEVRPDVDWDKGRATAFLLDVVAGDDEAPVRVPGSPRLPAIFIGDDRTDEDAFDVVEQIGGGIVVGDPPSDTRAVSWLRGPGEVAELIRRLADG
ncbi:MAG: trehalose-phosphatase [Longimicrobiales bacterium]|nr:trehalose-phosphatase [Longimicrobiales bacterium]